MWNTGVGPRIWRHDSKKWATQRIMKRVLIVWLLAPRCLQLMDCVLSISGGPTPFHYPRGKCSAENVFETTVAEYWVRVRQGNYRTCRTHTMTTSIPHIPSRCFTLDRLTYALQFQKQITTFRVARIHKKNMKKLSRNI